MTTQGTFESAVADVDRNALDAKRVRTLMLNVGLKCTQSCTHCHVDASPQRVESMDDTTLAACIELASELRPEIVDVTGGAPELYPRLHDLVIALERERIRTRVRTNLSALFAADAGGIARDLADHGVELLGSFPGPSAVAADRQRGPGSHDVALEALWRLNALGYGTRLRLDLAHNPIGTHLPESSDLIDRRYRAVLSARGVSFNDVLVITNVPVGRFGDDLRRRGAYDQYIDSLRCAFNPRAVPMLECRETIEVGWDGTLYDCDFNLGAGLPAFGSPVNVAEVSADEIASRRIAFGEHCFACTAAAGSG